MGVNDSAATPLSSFRNRRPVGAGLAGRDPVAASRTLELFDVEVLRQAVAESGLEHRQIGRGPFRGELKRVHLGPLCLDGGHYTQTLQSRGCFGSSNIVIGCILGAQEAGCINAHRFGRHDLVIFPEGAEMDYLVPAHTQWVAIQAPRSLLVDAGADGDALNRVAVYSATRPANPALAELLRGLFGPVVAEASWPGDALDMEALVAELLDRLRLALSPRDVRSHTRRSSFRKRADLVRRFDRAISDAGPRLPRIPELATDLGVSQRTLEQVFREHLGISPRRFAILTKLNKVYCDLLRSSADNTTVAELAQRQGIRQLGRFSAEYRAQFGELPSETLRRPR